MNILAQTGEVCPAGGVWYVIGDPAVTATIAKDVFMPRYRGTPVIWRLLRKI